MMYVMGMGMVITPAFCQRQCYKVPTMSQCMMRSSDMQARCVRSVWRG